MEKVFILDMGGKAESVSVDRLKPAHLDLDQPVRVAIPKRRGRPANNRPHKTANKDILTPHHTSARPQRDRQPPDRYQGHF